ncbi:Mth938-like domain-containing protein [Conchiformibius kuhniae]|uniref:Mth938-like domain-containing protein n=1 Tax=Conchiformibius kuhniae TaxID=211502 RepID=A0A8T9MYY5_9NEIS|nr:Mth938-like domain-containing protein [Conchiformibius kuhniae]UOP05402.1 Mth938-like domain-containing protein [Conchiformibius kuhniae]
MNIEEVCADVPVIDAITPEGLHIGGQCYRAVILGGGAVSAPAEAAWTDLTADSFRAAREAGAEVVLLGTGAKQHFLPAQIIAALAAQGIGIECMNTAAAARTFTLLQSEGRKVWAWLWL